MNWSTTEQDRYSRHFLLEEVGEAGQERLKNSRILVVGAGGLGCPVLQYLVAAGVGTVGIIDPDVIELSNLQRQVLYGKDDIGRYKALVAKRQLEHLNPHVQIQAYPYALDTSNALELIEQYDLVVDGSDNFATRYLVNDACVLTNRPFVYGSMYKFEGQIAVFNHQGGTTYRCLFPTPPSLGEVPNCSEVGVLGALAGIIGTLQATEALKVILEIGTCLSGKLMVYQALLGQWTTLSVPMNPTARTLVEASRKHFHTLDYEHFCGISKQESIDELSPETLSKTLAAYLIVDVREQWEQPRLEVLQGIDIPLPRLMTQTSRIPKDQPVVVVCAKGIRSRIAIDQLKEKFGYTNLYNLKGGIKAWEEYHQSK